VTTEWAEFTRDTVFGIVDRATAERDMTPRATLADWELSGGIGEILIIAALVGGAVWLLFR